MRSAWVTLIILGQLGGAIAPSVAMASANVDWSRVLHHVVSRNLNYNSRRMQESLYYSTQLATDLAAIPVAPGTVVDLKDTPTARIQSRLGNPAVLQAQFGQPTFDYLPANLRPAPQKPYVKSIFESPVFDQLTKQSNYVFVIVPGLGSEYLPLIPFGEAVKDYRFFKDTKDPYNMIVASVSNASSAGITAGMHLGAFLSEQTPLNYPQYQNKQIIFLAYDAGVSQVLELLKLPAYQSIANRTRFVVSLGGLNQGLPLGKWGTQTAKGAHYLAHVLALTGEYMSALLGNPSKTNDQVSGYLTGAFDQQLNSAIDSIASNYSATADNSAVLSSVAKPAIQYLESTGAVATARADLTQRARDMLVAAVLPKVPGGIPADAFANYQGTIKDSATTYANILRDTTKGLLYYAPAQIKPRTTLLLSQIKRADGKPITFFTIGALADPADFRITPDVQFDGQKLNLLPLGQGKAGNGGFSWDDLIWSLVGQSGFYQTALTDGVIPYANTLLPATSNPGVKIVDLGLFRADHWGLAVGGVLSPKNPFPRTALLEAIFETLYLYDKNN